MRCRFWFWNGKRCGKDGVSETKSTVKGTGMRQRGGVRCTLARKGLEMNIEERLSEKISGSGEDDWSEAPVL